jgi:hypothetical protein
MRQRSVGMVERHCEKGAVVVCGAVTLWLGWAFLLRSPNRVAFEGRSLTPRDLHQAILRETEALEQCMADAETPAVEFPSYGRWLEATHAGGVFGGEDDPGGLLRSPKLRPAVPFGRGVDLQLKLPCPVRVVTPTAPRRPWLFTGRCLITQTCAGDRTDSADAGSREVGWVRIMTRLDRESQRAAYLDAGYPEYAAQVYLVGVDAQRQESPADGGFGSWVPVEPATAPPAEAMLRSGCDDRTGDVEQRNTLHVAFVEVKAAQGLIGRMRFEEILAGERPPITPGAAVSGADANADATLVWVDDVNVEAGKSYRYRVRVRLWNRFAGRPSLVVEAADAERAVIAGEWSEPSELVRAAPQTHFFVLGQSVDRTAANIEVRKWHRGQWLRKLFTPAVGDVIGELRTVRLPAQGGSGQVSHAQVDFDTGVTLLGMRNEVASVRVVDQQSGRFRWVEKPTLVVVCVDRASGGVAERSQVEDREDRLRARLRGP